MPVVALAYATLALIAVLFQLAMAAGAPWGHLTLHGRYPGRFPPAQRKLAVVQELVLALMALVVLAHSELMDSSFGAWAIWPVLPITALSTLANLTSPSRPERYLWGSVTVLMLACGLIVAIA
jgi:hypothetical protein